MISSKCQIVNVEVSKPSIRGSTISYSCPLSRDTFKDFGITTIMYRGFIIKRDFNKLFKNAVKVVLEIRLSNTMISFVWHVYQEENNSYMGFNKNKISCTVVDFTDALNLNKCSKYTA